VGAGGGGQKRYCFEQIAYQPAFVNDWPAHLHHVERVGRRAVTARAPRMRAGRRVPHGLRRSPTSLRLHVQLVEKRV
jgi:hypothetical protein